MKQLNVLKKLGILFLSATLLLCGCGNANENETETEDYSYLEKLEQDTYYVRHENKECEKVVFGNATFDEGDIASAAIDYRVIWFKENFEEIPTLYKGESLIYCTESELKEEFNFERFEDFGYSIGICGLKPTVSGRYSLSTNIDDRNTYPEGDTDEILMLENELVIMDTLGGKQLRVPLNEEDETGDITRCGTIKGLKKGNSYKAEIYAGTIRHEYVFTADVKILGSMEVVETTDYFFESERIINIEIPEEFNSGYYMINGIGIFRYINGDTYDENTDFNVPNITEEKNDLSTQIGNNSGNGSNNVQIEASTESTEEEIIDIKSKTFALDEEKIVTIIAEVDETGDMSKIKGYIVSPSGERYEMNIINHQMEITIDVVELGEYTIEFVNLGDATVNVNII